MNEKKQLLREIEQAPDYLIKIDIQSTNNFWSSLEKFRKSQDFKNVEFEAEDFVNLRDKTAGRNIEI